MISLQNVTKKFANGHVGVDEVTLRIKPGEFVVLIGPSGCGKTTTMKMINRLIEPTGGKIEIEGQDISKLDPIQLRRRIGYVIQEIGLLPHMTVAENIAVVPHLQRWPKTKQTERVVELLQLMGLDPATTMPKYPRELSGGQRQRIGVARALAVDPPIMLMDEPFGALDPITREELQDEFIKLQRQVKKTIVFVTHDMDEALKFADRIVIMNNGKIVQCDTPQQILRNPANNFVRDFVGTDHTLKQLSLVKVRDAMISEIDTLRSDDNIGKAQSIFAKGYRSIVIVDAQGKAAGYINKEDVEQCPFGTTVSQVMITSLSKIEQNLNLKEALSIMVRNDAGYLAVVDEEEKMVGIITSNCLHKIVGEPYLQANGSGV